MCIHQEANGEAFNCPVKALARRVIHIWEHEGDNATLLSAFYLDGQRYNVTGDDISKGIKNGSNIATLSIIKRDTN